MSAFLAAVSQRAFWSESQIKDLVVQRRDAAVQAMYDSEPASGGGTGGDPRAMMIFTTSKQKTWLVTYHNTVFCVLDDRKWEEPTIRWQTHREAAVPVAADENWSVEAGVLRFGAREKGWLYSKDLFSGESAASIVGRFLAENVS